MRILVEARTLNRFEEQYNVYLETSAENAHLSDGKHGNSRNERYKGRKITQ